MQENHSKKFPKLYNHVSAVHGLENQYTIALQIGVAEGKIF